MIDKVAAAIATFATGSADNYKNFRDEARAAIEAMMEPTVGMVEAGLFALSGAANSGSIDHLWQAMLQAALPGDQEG